MPTNCRFTTPWRDESSSTHASILRRQSYNILTRLSFNGIMPDRWGPGPESAGAIGDAGQARAERRSRRGGGPDRVWRGSWPGSRSTTSPRAWARKLPWRDFPLFPLPRYPLQIDRFRGAAKLHYPATSPAENGVRYFPVILTVTTKKLTYCGWGCERSPPLFFHYFKRYSRVTALPDLSGREVPRLRFAPLGMTESRAIGDEA